MKLIFIRHADPDDDNNKLTEVGINEAKILGEYLKDLKFDSIYTSPYPRAKLTALEIMKYHEEEKLIDKEWLHEFDYCVDLPYEKNHITWDMYPDFYVNNLEFYDVNKYLDLPYYKKVGIKEKYLNVVNEFDEVLRENGYVRNNNLYETGQGNKKVLVFVLHFGLMCVLMSHLMNIPYSLLANTMICPPTGITTFYSEERKEGQVRFRCNGFGDISHLSIKGVKPSFHGRFCEIFYSNERH